MSPLTSWLRNISSNCMMCMTTKLLKHPAWIISATLSQKSFVSEHQSNLENTKKIYGQHPYYIGWVPNF